MARLLALWRVPEGPLDGPVLSFLPPAREEALAERLGPRLIRAREMPAAVRARARADYLTACAAPAARPDAHGKTLRREMSDGGVSSWWFHPVSFKDCEGDPVFDRVLAARAVLWAANSARAGEVELVGAPGELADALSGVIAVSARSAPWRAPEALWWLRALASRVRLLVRTGLDLLACAFAGPTPSAPGPEIFLLGYWDWSCRETDGRIADRYFKDLPEALERRGRSVGWLCWLDPDGDPARPSVGRFSAAASAARAGKVTLLQSFLDPGDLLEALLDLRPLGAYLRRRHEPAFRAAFRAADGLDLFPLLEEYLLRGVLDGGMPRCELMRRACRRAGLALAPRAAIHFLEHFPHARAAFAGLAEARVPLTAAVQHASFCREKTFYFLDPALEFRGEPDSQPAPTPGLVFAMGAQAAEHFRACGYPPSRVRLSGSPRYDHVRPPRPARSRPGGGVRVLLAPALDLNAEAAMLEAVDAAALGLPRVELRLRDHPFARLSERPEYAARRSRVALSSGTLAQDFEWADLILFTYSTVAEEGVLGGLPAWQWRPLGYDASALSEENGARPFASVSALRAALDAFKPGDGLPDDGARARLAERLFHEADGRAAERVASALDEALA